MNYTVCPMCQRFFDPATGLPVEGLKDVSIQNVTDHHICLSCSRIPAKPTTLSHSRDIIHCHAVLQEKWPELLKRYQKETGRDLTLTCTWRSEAEQQSLFAQGRTKPGKIVTNIDGVTKRSRHNFYPSEAFDVAVDLNPDVSKVEVSWDADKYLPLHLICVDLGLEWGGAWKTLHDYPHVQLP